MIIFVHPEEFQRVLNRTHGKHPKGSTDDYCEQALSSFVLGWWISFFAVPVDTVCAGQFSRMAR